MLRHFTLEYRLDEGRRVGRPKEVPGVFNQGETLEELEENIKEAYKLVMEDDDISIGSEIRTKEVGVEV